MLAFGLLLKKWDSRGFCISTTYDNHGRHIYQYVSGEEGKLKMDINVKIILEENIKSYMIKTDKKNLQKLKEN
jgi:hypothetical protein